MVHCPSQMNVLIHFLNQHIRILIKGLHEGDMGICGVDVFLLR